MVDDSDGSDEWGMEELVLPPKTSESQEKESDDPGQNNDDYWKVEPKATGFAAEKPKPLPPSKSSTPMIIVDITQMDPNIHSKFDKNSVNDSAAASSLRKTMEADYEKHSKDPELLSNGTVIPCSSGIWRDALIRLREERSGHYFAPIFPTRKT